MPLNASQLMSALCCSGSQCTESTPLLTVPHCNVTPCGMGKRGIKTCNRSTSSKILVVLAGFLCTGCCSSLCTTWRSASSEPLGHCRGTWWLPMLLAPCPCSPSCSWGALSFPRRLSTPGSCGCTGSTPCSGLKELSRSMSSVHHAGVPSDPEFSRSDPSPTTTGACINNFKKGQPCLDN